MEIGGVRPAVKKMPMHSSCTQAGTAAAAVIKSNCHTLREIGHVKVVRPGARHPRSTIVRALWPRPQPVEFQAYFMSDNKHISPSAETSRPSNFLRQIIERDLAQGTYAGRRFAGSPGDAARPTRRGSAPASRPNLTATFTSAMPRASA